MASPTSIAITLNACLLFGGAMTVVVSNAARADDPVANPTGGGGSVQLEAVPERASPRHRRVIFVCHEASPVIFSDRPCGQLFEQRTFRVEAPEPTTAGRAATTSPQPAAASTRAWVEPAPRGEPLRAGDGRCRRLREELGKLDDRMRTGYPAREAAKLWNRWRALHSEIYAARC